MKISTLLLFFISLVSCSLFSQNGLKGDYYDGINFERFVGTRIDTKIDYYWLWKPPFKGMNPNKCSVRWTGRLMAPETGEFIFSASVDDGVRVWVDEVQIIDNWRLNNMAHSKGSFKMEKGKYYDLKIEYFNAMAEAEITLFWELPKQQQEKKEKHWYDIFWLEDKEEKEKIPSNYFFQPVEKKIVELKEEEEEIVESTKPKKQSTNPKTKKRRPKKQFIIPKESKTTAEIKIEKYIPKNVQFERTKTEILPQSFPELDRLAEFLTKNQHHKIKIEGHTDNVGNEEKNLKLSQSRARAVAAYLIKKGVHFERLSAEGFGGSQPLVQSEGRNYHPENRRVEFIVE